jgi:hypothetical protein
MFRLVTKYCTYRILKILMVLTVWHSIVLAFHVNWCTGWSVIGNKTKLSVRYLNYFHLPCILFSCFSQNDVKLL